MSHVSTPPYLYVHQADAVLAQANPVSGTKYTVLNTTENVRIIGIYVKVTWTVQPTPLEIHVTIDGQALTFTIANPVSNTPYYAHFVTTNAPAFQVLDIEAAHINYRAFLFEGRSVKVEAETTGGTTSALDARIIYAKI